MPIEPVIAESKTRDWLAKNLQVVELGLELIKKEFHLPDPHGASGYIDILCKDVFNNFVIIEIKKNDKTARQTIHEVLKYFSLVKHNYQARESEIRIIIISTSWRELLRPFSETCNKTSIAIKGFSIQVNERNGSVKTISVVNPLPKSYIARQFAYSQGLYLFKGKRKRQSFIKWIENKLHSCLLNDFVLIETDAPLNKKQLEYHYALVVLFQSQEPTQWCNLIRKLKGFEDDEMTSSDFDTAEEYLHCLEGTFINSLDTQDHDDSAEAGYPEKFESIVGVQGWKVKKIFRYGIFSSDPRYSNELLLKEAKGHDGTNRNKFSAFAESSQPKRIEELQDACMNCLNQTPAWQKFINYILKNHSLNDDHFRIIMDIYNPDSLLMTLYFTLINRNPGYMPEYVIVFDKIDSPETVYYIGEIKWNLETPISKFFSDQFTDEVSNLSINLWFDPENDKISEELCLIYTNRKVVVRDGKVVEDYYMKFENGELIYDNSIYKNVPTYLLGYKREIENFMNNMGSVYKIYGANMQDFK